MFSCLSRNRLLPSKPVLKKRNIHLDRVRQDKELEALRFETEGRVGYCAVDITGLDRGDARWLVADLQDARFFHRVDAEALEHGAHAEVGGGAESADTEFFTFQLLHGLDLGPGDQLVVELVEQAGEVNDIRALEIGRDARRAAQLRQIEIPRDQYMDVGRAAGNINRLDVETVFSEDAAVLGDIHQARL